MTHPQGSTGKGGAAIMIAYPITWTAAPKVITFENARVIQYRPKVTDIAKAVETYLPSTELLGERVDTTCC